MNLQQLLKQYHVTHRHTGCSYGQYRAASVYFAIRECAAAYGDLDPAELIAEEIGGPDHSRTGGERR